jgi:hypothetical protein
LACPLTGLILCPIVGLVGGSGLVLTATKVVRGRNASVSSLGPLYHGAVLSLDPPVALILGLIVVVLVALVIFIVQSSR